MSRLMNEALSSALDPIRQQLSKINGGSTDGSAISDELSELKLKHQLLQIETKAAALSSDGSRSQYRCLATIDMKLNNAVESLDDLMLTRPSPEDEIYKSLLQIK